MFAYPLMAQAVRDFLPVPSAEVGIERVFSGGRDVLGLRRQSMSAEIMQWLMLNEKSEVLYISILCLELDS
jgi:hypothetical protein